MMRKVFQVAGVIVMAILIGVILLGVKTNITGDKVAKREAGFAPEVFNLPLHSGEDMPIPRREWSAEEFNKFMFPAHPGEEMFPVNPDPEPKRHIEPLLSNDLQPGEIKNGLLGGEWYYEYDVLFFNRYTWISSVEVGGVLLNVRVAFDDWDAGSSPHNLAFRLSPEDYKPFTLHIKKDGQFDPELSHFKKLYADEYYPGGYDKFEKDLRELGIDWITLFEMLDEEFQLQYLQLDPEKHWPPGPKDPQPEIDEVHA